MVHTSFDVSQGMDQYKDKLTDCIQASSSHVENMVASVVVERVTVGIVGELIVCRDFLSQKKSHGFVLAMSGHKVHHESTEFVNDEGTAGNLVQIYGFELLILGPSSIQGINVTITYK